MPDRVSVRKILIFGSGPTVIGHADELDLLGQQALLALKEEGCEVVLLHSDPSTFITNPVLADRTYLEPMTPEVAERIIERERPDAVLPIAGGQKGMILAFQLARGGVLDRHGARMLGVTAQAMERIDDANGFHRAMAGIGISVPESGIARTSAEGSEIADRLGFPLIVRPAFTLGRTVCVYNRQEFEPNLKKALGISPTGQVEIQRSLAGWRTVAIEVVRDEKGRTRAVAAMENVDPMGVNTGDSVVVCPAQTLGRGAIERLIADAERAVDRMGCVGVASVQFAVRSETGETRAVDITAHLSRGTALASKVAGLSLGRIAARLAIGRGLDEAMPSANATPAAIFSDAADFVACRVPRFASERFPTAERRLTSSMRSVGESIGIAPTFRAAFQRAIRALDAGRMGLGYDGAETTCPDVDECRVRLLQPDEDRYYTIRAAFEAGMSADEVAEASGIDPMFVREIERIVARARELRAWRGRDTLAGIGADLLAAVKADGFSDGQIARLTDTDEQTVRAIRDRLGVRPVFRAIESAEAGGRLLYPVYGAPESPVSRGERRMLVLSGGPMRIGQGIEYDACCVNASRALCERGYEAVVVNPNPASSSTDPAHAARIYLAPLTAEDVLEIVREEKPEGAIVQMGGGTAERLARVLEDAGVPILGTSADSMDRATSRERLGQLVRKLSLSSPAVGSAREPGEVRTLCEKAGLPVVARLLTPQGSRAMSIVHTDEELDRFLAFAGGASDQGVIAVDRFLDYATEADVDALADGESVYVAGILEHIEEAGVNAGDSAGVLPPHTLPATITDRMRSQTERIALELGVRGLINIHFAVKGDRIHVLGVTPRAGRTVPFVAKATGVPLATLATRVLLGERLADLATELVPSTGHVSVRESVFPFARFPGVDPVLGPEMRSTGRVMGIDRNYGLAFMKSQQGAGQMLPTSGTVFFSMKDADKRPMVPLARKFADLGFSILATRGTADVLARNGIEHTLIPKLTEGRPNIVDRIINREVHLLINTPSGQSPNADEVSIRRKAYAYGVPLVTTLSGAFASADGIEALQQEELSVRSLQEYHAAGRG